MTDMEYRRLGRSGLQVSVLSFGSWVSFGAQLDTDAALDCLDVAYQGGMNFFDNAEAYAGRRVRADHGRGDRAARVAAPLVRHLHQALLGDPRRREHEQHAEPQVPPPGDRRLARAARPRVRRPPLLPPRRSEHADRGDGVGDVRHRRQRSGHVLGHVGVDRGRDPRRVGDRRPPSPAQAGRGAARVQHPAAAGGSSASTRGSTRTSGSASPRGARSRPACSPASTSTACRRTAARRSRATSGCARCSPTRRRTRRSRKLQSIAAELDCSLAQLSLAWCAKNPHVSSVITGASRPEQVKDNLGALDVLPRLDDDVDEADQGRRPLTPTRSASADAATRRTVDAEAVSAGRGGRTGARSGRCRSGGGGRSSSSGSPSSPSSARSSRGAGPSRTAR